MNHFPLIAATELQNWLMTGGILLVVMLTLLAVVVIFNYGSLWFQAYMSDADVSWTSLIGMSLRRVKASSIVQAQVMAQQAGLTIAQGRGRTTASLEAHYLAGGDVRRVILAIIAAHRAGIDLDFERAAAIDLAGRDLQEAVRTSIFPKVIDCPDAEYAGNTTSLSAIAKNGVELLTQVRVTVRTNLDQLIGGATEQTIIARVGQGIVSTIGSMESHAEALEKPDRISKTVLQQGVQSNTAYEIVSVDIATIDVGRNIGARLQTEQAEADTRVARAKAEIRGAEAIALEQEMKALVTANRAALLLSRSRGPHGIGWGVPGGTVAFARRAETRIERKTGEDIQVSRFTKRHWLNCHPRVKSHSHRSRLIWSAAGSGLLRSSQPASQDFCFAKSCHRELKVVDDRIYRLDFPVRPLMLRWGHENHAPPTICLSTIQLIGSLWTVDVLRMRGDETGSRVRSNR